MKRILILFILLVLVAVAINLTIALGFWRFGKRPSKHDFIGNNGIVEIGPQEVVVWRDRRQPEWPLDPDKASMYKFFGITHRVLSWHNVGRSGTPGDVNFKMTKMVQCSIFNQEFGWPLRCIAEERWVELRKPIGSYQSSETFNVFGVPAPNRVLWTGMFINVLYYCLSIALAFLCWSYIRSGLRQMSNHCIKCGYDLHSVFEQGCPECGWGREAKG